MSLLTSAFPTLAETQQPETSSSNIIVDNGQPVILNFPVPRHGRESNSFAEIPAVTKTTPFAQKKALLATRPSDPRASLKTVVAVVGNTVTSELSVSGVSQKVLAGFSAYLRRELKGDEEETLLLPKIDKAAVKILVNWMVSVVSVAWTPSLDLTKVDAPALKCLWDAVEALHVGLAREVLGEQMNQYIKQSTVNNLVDLFASFAGTHHKLMLVELDRGLRPYMMQSTPATVVALWKEVQGPKSASLLSNTQLVHRMPREFHLYAQSRDLSSLLQLWTLTQEPELEQPRKQVVHHLCTFVGDERNEISERGLDRLYRTAPDADFTKFAINSVGMRLWANRLTDEGTNPELSELAQGLKDELDLLWNRRSQMWHEKQAKKRANRQLRMRALSKLETSQKTMDQHCS